MKKTELIHFNLSHRSILINKLIKLHEIKIQLKELVRCLDI
jgi:hypothetical protein